MGPAPPTARPTSPSSRGSRRCASGPACTSARPVRPACTTLSGRSSTTPSTRPWRGAATRIDVTLLADGGCRVTDDGAGIPVGAAPEVPQAVDRRDRPDHPARRRQVRRQGLPGLGRAARRGGLGRQRPLDAAAARGRPGRPALGGGVREGRQGQAQGHGNRPGAQGPRPPASRGPAPPSPSGPTPPSSTRPSSGRRRSSSACRSWPS